ncbi:hypothetical protein C723_2118 [Christiangramia flava JLT2011]|uniref:Uncharacterized protein n=1 Tax=Christiangramia flava JLT2011 TaxID=1229726 RepID=A0A1L7I6D3_9FLAO|nr:hypothetical protein GRFL_2019 [Christiangramia flava JLT2011]OSS39112.1 hypothetical protein C723_2118 [Christiangramia flava JLT2011]
MGMKENTGRILQISETEPIQFMPNIFHETRTYKENQRMVIHLRLAFRYLKLYPEIHFKKQNPG